MPLARTSHRRVALAVVLSRLDEHWSRKGRLPHEVNEVGDPPEQLLQSNDSKSCDHCCSNGGRLHARAAGPIVSIPRDLTRGPLDPRKNYKKTLLRDAYVASFIRLQADTHATSTCGIAPQ